MRIAFIGCGYAADYYAMTVANHPSLELAGVFDRNQERQDAFSRFHNVAGYPSLDSLLGDPGVGLVVNLTSPASHTAVTEAALTAGKHVYSEKPFALSLEGAIRLADLARSRGLLLGSAPCNLLSETAQTAWRALRSGAIGTPRLAYAELEAGPIMTMNPHKWESLSGAPFPLADEITTGWITVHAAYYLSWLTAFFGPVSQLTTFSAEVVPTDLDIPAGAVAAPDFSVACLAFGNGVVARLTCGMAAPRDQSLRLIGDQGVITVENGGCFTSPVTLSAGHDDPGRPIPLLNSGIAGQTGPDFPDYDFCRGVADLAAAATGHGATHLPIDHALHVLELTLALSAEGSGAVVRPTTTFAPVHAASWATGPC